jgi:DNA-binding transcriptional LysR family regulator
MIGNMDNDRLALLDTFARIVDAGNLSAAAAQLGTTQATVSRRLQNLEKLLGVRLLNRSTHAVTLTEDGSRCYERTKELLVDWQSFESEVRGKSAEPSGLLRVFVPHAFGQQQLIPPLVDYLQAHAGMSVEWLLNDRMPNFIAEGVECAIRVGAVTEPNVVALPLGEVARIAVAAPGLVGKNRPATPAQLAHLPWLALQTFYRDHVELTHAATGRHARFPIQPRMSTDSLYALRSVALAGAGAAILSTWAVREDIATGRLVHLAPDWQAAPLPISLVYPPARFQPARLRSFIDIMRQALPTLFGAAQRGPASRSSKARLRSTPQR